MIGGVNMLKTIGVICLSMIAFLITVCVVQLNLHDYERTFFFIGATESVLIGLLLSKIEN